jgi:hypothetical protein
MSIQLESKESVQSAAPSKGTFIYAPPLAPSASEVLTTPPPMISPPSWRQLDLNKQKVNTLKAILAQLELPQTGKKFDLVQRLRAHLLDEYEVEKAKAQQREESEEKIAEGSSPKRAKTAADSATDAAAVPTAVAVEGNGKQGAASTGAAGAPAAAEAAAAPMPAPVLLGQPLLSARAAAVTAAAAAAATSAV